MANDTEVHATATGGELLVLLEILAGGSPGSMGGSAPRQRKIDQLFWEYLDPNTDAGLQASKLYHGDLEGLHNFLLANEEAIKSMSFEFDSLSENAGCDMSNAIYSLLVDIRAGKISLPD